MSTDQQASCLCSAVKINTEKLKHNVGVCHCGMCRKWTGGPLLAIETEGKVSFEGEENITRFKSSQWAERGFCRKCGSHLFYHLLDSQQYIMPVGLFDIDDELFLEHQIFIEEKPDYYSFSQKTKNMTGAEVFAEFEKANNG